MADKDSRDVEVDVAPHVELDGSPWGEYADPDLAYVRGQTGSVGSGALGGWSGSNRGGLLEVSGDETQEILAEARRILGARSGGS
jgi:hypothetical protein